MHLSTLEGLNDSTPQVTNAVPVQYVYETPTNYLLWTGVSIVALLALYVLFFHKHKEEHHHNLLDEVSEENNI